MTVDCQTFSLEILGPLLWTQNGRYETRNSAPVTDLAFAGTNAALLVIDMQNGSCRLDGSVARAGLDVRRSAAVVPAVGEVLVAARRAGIAIFYTRNVFLPGLSNAGLISTAEHFPRLKAENAFVRGSTDADIVDELRPLANEPVVDKTRYSAFFETDLHDRLQAVGVNTLIFTGISTNICVESTVRDAFFRDYHNILVEDAVAERDPRRHEATLLAVAYTFGRVATRAEVIVALDRIGIVRSAGIVPT